MPIVELSFPDTLVLKAKSVFKAPVKTLIVSKLRQEFPDKIFDRVISSRHVGTTYIYVVMVENKPKDYPWLQEFKRTAIRPQVRRRLERI